MALIVSREVRVESSSSSPIMLRRVVAVIILFVLTNIRIVPQSKAFVIERLGAYYATWDTGLHVKIPFIDRVAKTYRLKSRLLILNRSRLLLRIT